MKIRNITLSSVLFIFILTVVFSSCKKDSSSKLGEKKDDSKIEKLVEELNSQCPVKYDFVKVTSFKREENTIVINYTVDDNFLAIQKLSKDVVYDVWRLFYLDACSKNDKKLIKTIESSGYSIKCVFTDSKSQQKVSIDVSNDQLKNNKPLSIDENINTNVEIARSLLPQQLDDITNLVRIDLNKEQLTYIYEVNENLFDISEMENNSSFKQVLGNNIKQQFFNNSPAGELFKKLCLSDRGLCYRYIGNKTGKIVNLFFTNQELKQMENSREVK